MKNRKKLTESCYVLTLISVVIILLSLFNKDIFWMPLFWASIVTIGLILVSFWIYVSYVDFYCLALLSVGGIVSSSVVSDNEGVLSSSIIVLGLSVLGLMIYSRSNYAARGDDSSGVSQLDEILESVQMSENAKRVLFRDRELNLLRRTVQEDLTRGEFHSALVLCDQMANVFGAVEEAEELRTKVQDTIHEQHEHRIKNEIGQLNALLEVHKWVEAYQLASKLRRLFPESPLLHGIEQKIADVRMEYRHGLEERFLVAAKQENVELSMNLLRELDGYLTPDEARKFRDTATAVITTYRESLSARFKMAVSDHRWQEAIEFGIEITKQFPNTKMAEEVQSMLETIRVRADEDETTI